MKSVLKESKKSKKPEVKINNKKNPNKVQVTFTSEQLDIRLCRITPTFSTDS